MSDGAGQLCIFDTDFLSECLRQNAAAIACLEAIPFEQWRTTVINEGELLTGRYQQLQTADTVKRVITAQLRLDQTKAFLAAFPAILKVDEVSAQLLFDLARRRGLRKIGRRDLMIAAVALHYAAVLVTGNARDFDRIPKLKVRDWRDR